MAQVTLPVTFVDGQLLKVDDLNRALYDKAPGKGVYSEPNGGIELSPAGNGASTFRLQQEHVQPGQVVKARYEGNWQTLDNMSDVSGRTTVAANNVKVGRQQALPGCSVRVYVPFDATAIRWNFGFFWYVTKWLGLGQTDNDFTSQGASIQTYLLVDGIEQPEWRRDYPMTWFKRAVANYTASSGNNEAPVSTEMEQASFTNLSFLQTAASVSSPKEVIPAGFHEAFIGFYVKPATDEDGDVVTYLRDTVVKFTKETATVQKTLEVYQRFSVGCNNARVVAFR